MAFTTFERVVEAPIVMRRYQLYCGQRHKHAGSSRKVFRADLIVALVAFFRSSVRAHVVELKAWSLGFFCLDLRIVLILLQILIDSPLVIYLTNRFHVAVRLFSNRSQMTSKCGKNKKVAHEAIAECVTDVLTTFSRPL